MEGNQSQITEFILVGFQLSEDMELVLFGVFSLLYTFNLLANGMILGLISLEPRLHTPMYYFLSHLAVTDVAYASSHLPNMLENLVKHKKTISYFSCTMQMVSYLAFASVECLTLVVMSYDRFVAICHPLQYTVIMNWRVCAILAFSVGATGFSLSLVQVVAIFRLPFCKALIEHFFHDVDLC